MRLIDKDALVAWAKETYLCENASMIRKVCFKQLLEYLNTLEVKEVDLEKDYLTWEDIPKLLSISERLKTGWWFVDRTKEIGTQVFWEEVLKRFKAQKEEGVW